MSGFKRLVGEVHRRSLWQILGIYLAGSWIALQVVEQISEAMQMPEWVRPLAIILFIVGLPIVLATAFVQEGIGSRDVDETAPGDAPAPLPSADPEGATRLLTWRNALAGGVIAFAALGVTAVGWVVFGPGPGTLVGGDGSGSIGPSVAVLPFENLNAGDENQVFTEGIHQDVISQLQTVGDLRVIGRQSVLEYREGAADPGTVGRELSVGTVVTASVQRSGDRVRVSAALIDVDSEEQLWAEQYDRTLTDVFEIQSDIAGQIVAALASNLTLPARPGSDRPTESFEAYEHYLRGSQLMGLAEERLERTAVDVARDELENAIELDPAFAEAQALLAIAYDRLSGGAQFDVAFGEALGGTGRAGEVEAARPGFLREQARRAAERALELDPELADAHFALWSIDERVGRDGLPHLERAMELQPGNALFVAEMADAQLARGAWGKARDLAVRATTLNPRSAAAHLLLGQITRFTREFEEAELALDTAARLASGDPLGYANIMRERLWLELALGGGVEGAKRVFDAEQLRGVAGPDQFRIRFTDSPEVLVGGEYDDLILSFRPDATDVLLRCTCYYQKAMMYRASGEMDRARIYFDSLISERAENAPSFTNRVEQASWLTLQARDLARAGRDESARERLAESLRITADTTLLDRRRLTDIRRFRAMAYAELGDADRAIEELEHLLSVPSAITPYTLRDRQAWLPLRGDPAFEAFVEAQVAAAEAAAPR